MVVGAEYLFSTGQASLVRAEQKAWELFRREVPDFRTVSKFANPPTPPVTDRKRTLIPLNIESNFRGLIQTLSPGERREYIAKREEEIIQQLFDTTPTSDGQSRLVINPITQRLLFRMQGFRKQIIIDTYLNKLSDEEIFEKIKIMAYVPTTIEHTDIQVYRDETMMLIGFRLGIFSVNDIIDRKTSRR